MKNKLTHWIHRVRRSSVVLIFMVLVPVVWGAEEQKSPLTWADCVLIASQKNPDLRAAQKNLAASKASYYGSFNGYSPQITLSNTYSDSDSHNPDSRWGAQGTASMNFFNPTTNASIRSASASLRQAEASVRIASANLRFSLKQAFADLLFAQEKVRVAEKILDLRMDNSKMVTLSYESGRESKGNMLRAQAELRQAQADLASAHRDMRSSQQDLGRQLGLDEFAAVTATGTLATAPLPELPNTSLLVDQTPPVAQLEAALEIARAGLQSARSQLWPFLSGQYSRSVNGKDEFPNDTYQWNASIGLSYRLFGGGITSVYYAASAARRNLEQAAENLRSTRNQVRSNLESGWAHLADGIDQVQVQKQFLEAGQQRNKEAHVRYTSGLISFEDWELAVTDFVNSEKSAIQSAHDALVAEAQWEQALGKPLEEK
ncbi:MAG: TolC family protein [Elusimicrobia bacterium]|nr:TolC family protein [Candidatus Obscuribacterium magneticum]MCB4755845.1 TolC family protein [Candidatus Obscuribacterium magneticum]